MQDRQTLVEQFDVAIVGAGAAGMMCAIEAAGRGRRVLVVDHAAAAGEKIRISGGGRCNFTHLGTTPAQFISENPQFCISALSRYTPRDFVAWLDRHAIAYHEKAPGQLFCDGSARQIVGLLLTEMARRNVTLRLGATVLGMEALGDGGFRLNFGSSALVCRSLVVATGGKSIPKMGATGYGYEVAARFGLRMTPTRPGLVPLTLGAAALEPLSPLAGLSVESAVTTGAVGFEGPLLFTHRGLSGPAVLQASSYWREGADVRVDLAPGVSASERLRGARADQGGQGLPSILARMLPRRLAQHLALQAGAEKARIGDMSDRLLRDVAATVNAWNFKPVGTEGYRTAEVTVGGVDTRDLDSRSFQARKVSGLFFIGEVVDVTGWLGGYNFQWAWASGWCAGQVA